MMRRSAFFILALLMTAAVASAQSTRRKNLKPVKSLPQTHVVVQRDTLTDADSIGSLVLLSDFKKALASRVETVMITNLSATDTVRAVVVDIDYRTADGKQLNRREVTFRADVPPGETRHASVQSWDRQQLFYDMATPPGRKTGRHTAFNAVLTPLRLILSRRD